jgi:hypothetical protein
MSTLFDNSFYGDSHRWFVGVVEDVNDPFKLGRVRVRVRGLHSELLSEIDTADLPWAQVGLPTTEGGISGIGRMARIQPGAEVVGFFLDGAAAQLPFVTHVIPKMEYSSPIQNSTNADPRLSRAINAPNTGPGTGGTGNRNKIEPQSDAALGALGSTNAETAYNFFIANKFTPNQSAGIVGNLMQESGPGLSTTIKSAGTEQSFGIAQWNSAAAAGNRLGLLKEFASDLGREWTELEVQLRFIIHELTNYRYLGLGELLAAETIEEATEAFMLKYERPSDAQLQRRINFAYDIYKRMNT